MYIVYRPAGADTVLQPAIDYTSGPLVTRRDGMMAVLRFYSAARNPVRGVTRVDLCRYWVGMLPSEDNLGNFISVHIVQYHQPSQLLYTWRELIPGAFDGTHRAAGGKPRNDATSTAPAIPNVYLPWSLL